MGCKLVTESMHRLLIQMLMSKHLRFFRIICTWMGLLGHNFGLIGTFGNVDVQFSPRVCSCVVTR
jgi:hypothetical protein